MMSRQIIIAPRRRDLNNSSATTLPYRAASSSSRFNMQDRDYYTFDQGNMRFAALNSNHPADPDQAKWLDTVFANSGTRWRICFFHHPLYSSGQHASESRDTIRPAMEPMLTGRRDALVVNALHAFVALPICILVSGFWRGAPGRARLHDSDPDGAAR